MEIQGAAREHYRWLYVISISALSSQSIIAASTGSHPLVPFSSPLGSIWFLPWKHHSEPILCLHACNVASLPAVSLPFISACSWPSDPSCSEPEPWAVFVKRSLQRFSRGKGFSSTALLIYGWKTAHVQSFRKKNVWLIQGCIKKLYTL